MTIGSLLGWGLVELFPGTLPRGFERPAWAVSKVTAAILVSTANFDGHPGHVVNLALGLLGFLALMAAILVLFSSQRASNALTGLDESAIRGLLRALGCRGFAGLLRHPARQGRRLRAQRQGGGHLSRRAWASAWPAATRSDRRSRWPQAIDAWLRLADQYGWAPAVMGASEIGAHGLRAAPGSRRSGSATRRSWRPATFPLGGPEMKPGPPGRQPAEKPGITVRIRRHSEFDRAEDFAALIANADAWRDTETERGLLDGAGPPGRPAGRRLPAGRGASTRERRELPGCSRSSRGAPAATRWSDAAEPEGRNGVIELMVSAAERGGPSSASTGSR